MIILELLMMAGRVIVLGFAVFVLFALALWLFDAVLALLADATPKPALSSGKAPRSSVDEGPLLPGDWVAEEREKIRGDWRRFTAPRD